MTELEKISSDLGLESTDSEWGILNADADRVVEFIKYYFQNELDDSYYEYLNLVCDSMNDALLENKIKKEERELFKQFLIDIKPKEQFYSGGVGFSYWTNINPENEEFPVAKLIAAEK